MRIKLNDYINLINIGYITNIVTIKYFVDIIINITLLITFGKHDLIFKSKGETILKTESTNY